MDRTSKYRRIVIKAGSNVLTRDDGRPDTTRISSLVVQIARLPHCAHSSFLSFFLSILVMPGFQKI